MSKKKTIINLNGVITKEDGTEFTEKENEQFVDSFIEFVENQKCAFGGGFKLMTEKEYLEE